MSTRKVSPRKATVLTSIVLASTMIGGPALAASQIVAGPKSVRAAVTPSTVVSRLTMGAGPSTGGEKLMISGTGLATSATVDNVTTFTAKTVKFGTTVLDAGDVTALSTTALEVTVPAKGSAAKVAVLVGDATKGPFYTYVSPDLEVTTVQDDLDALEPSSDHGLKTATLTGTSFEAATTKVLVGGLPARATANTAGTTLSYSLPAGLTGVQDVVVTDPRNSVYVGHVEYTAKTPTLATASSYAVNEAITKVALTGTNLDAVTAVSFVKDATTERVPFVASADQGKLVVSVPKGVAKVGDLKVTTKFGKSDTIALERKASATPAVTAVEGAVASGGTVTLTGTDLVGLKAVKVTSAGGKIYAGLVSSVTSPTSATVKLPPMPVGTYGLVATTWAATSSVSRPFTVTSIAPTASSAAVDTAKRQVTVTGTNLKNVTRMVVKPATGTSITRTSGFTSATDGTTVAVTLASALADGTYGVVVTNALGSTTSVTLTVATAAPAPTVTDVVYAPADSGAGTPATLTLTGTALEVGVSVRYYLAADDPATGTVDTIDTEGASTSTVELAADLATGDYKVEVSTDGTTWSTAVDLTVA